MLRSFAALLALLPAVLGQGIGTFQAETHPSLSWQQCASGGSCSTRAGSVVLDSNWRWTHVTNNFTNCYTGNTWDSTLCPNGQTCATNCVLDGASYQSTYGISASGNALTLKFVTQSQQKNIGSRVYLLASDTQYQMFRLLNQEFTFDVDVSQLPCGLNGALYFVTMDADGGMAKYPTNRAGARYGTGYCDAQCPRDLKWINGKGNVEGWTPSSNDPNAGTGNTGTCCAEMDVWEANSISTAFTPHPCTTVGQSACTGTSCSRPNSSAGICDQPGCDFNSYRMGVKNFYGPGMTVNTNSKITVVTQFIGNPLTEIRRIWVQNGRVIQNSNTAISGMSTFNSITNSFCTAQKTAFNDRNDFSAKGGFSAMSQAMNQGMVLVMSIWDDHAANMLWLDSNYPTDRPATDPGVARGTCSTSSGVPSEVESQSPNAQVIFSNIKFGPLNSTYTAA